MDMYMPMVDGYEATQKIRELEEKHNAHNAPTSVSSRSPTKIIALTASVSVEKKQKSLSAGCDDFVSKPFRLEELLEVLSKHLDLQFPEDEAEAGSSRYPQGFVPHSTIPEPNYKVDAAALAVMPVEWIAQLHFTAAQGSDVGSLKLIAQIPPEYTSLIKALNNLVEQYQFDQLVALTQSKSSENL